MRRFLPVTVVLILVACADPVVTATPAMMTTTATPMVGVPSLVPSASPAPEGPVELDQLAWWAIDELGFGIIPEAPPDPDPPTQPGGFRQLMVGTLDGQITAVLALHPDWSHSYVAGPYGTDVLVATDTGVSSEVFVISALDGSRTDLFTTDAIVAAVAFGDDGTTLYTVEIDRATSVDSGLTRRPVGGGEVELMIEGPLATRPSEVPVYWVTADPLDGVVVAQWCHGQVSCASTAVQTADGGLLTEDRVGWPAGATDVLFFGDSLGGGQAASVWDLTSGAVQFVPDARFGVPVQVGAGWAFVRDDLDDPDGPTTIVTTNGVARHIPGVDPPGSSMGRGYDRGAALPAGWVLRHAPSRFFTVPELGPPPGHGQLIHAGTGERIDIAPFELAVNDGVGCDVLVPRRMANGTAVGSGVLELVDGRRTVRWGHGASAVHLSVGWRPASLRDGSPVATEIRGQPAAATFIGDGADAHPAITWTEAGCDYAVWLPAGTPIEEALEYAGRY